MARLNIEDSILKDDRFTELCIKSGSRIMALGIICETFLLAQKYFLTDSNACSTEINKRLIPLNEWQRKPTIHVMIDVGLAEMRENGIYVKGSEKHFNWLLQKQEAGKKSGASRRNKTVSSRTSVHSRSTKLNGSEPPSSLLSSPSSLLSTHNSNSSTSTSEVKNSEKELNSKIWEVYKESFFQRYKTEPVRNAAVNSKISQVGKRLGDDSLEVVKFYLQHNDGFYLKNLHSIGLCLRDCESLHTQWKRGVAITNTQVRAFEKNAQEIERQRQINTMWDDENA